MRNGPELTGWSSWMLSAVCGLFFRSSKMACQTCLGARFSLDNELTRNAASGFLSLMVSVSGPVASTLAIFRTNGLNIGALSPKSGATRLNTASSSVTGWPSLHFMPLRRVRLTVSVSGRSTFSAAQGCGRPSGPTRIRRSHTISVAQEPWPPGMLNGFRLVGGAVEFRITSFWTPRGAMLSQLQVLRMPMPACDTKLFESQTVLLYATTFFGCTSKPYG